MYTPTYRRPTSIERDPVTGLTAREIDRALLDFIDREVVIHPVFIGPDDPDAQAKKDARYLELRAIEQERLAYWDREYDAAIEVWERANNTDWHTYRQGIEQRRKGHEYTCA